MTGLYVAHRRRRRRRIYLSLAAVAFFIFIFRNYWVKTFNILIRGPFIAGHHSEHMRITQERDGFDYTFESYSSKPVEHVNSSMPVPPIMHHIFLGKPKQGKNESLAREACVAMHPGYEFRFWNDKEAEEFVSKYFPEYYDMWSSYPFVIQKADSLRYMILYTYGGIFLDLDLECLRPLEPLRRFDFVAPEATPMGISNGFIMVAPKHPFMRFVLDNLPTYNVNWFHLPYAVVMFSTGCHFLSTMLSLFPGRDSLHILWGPDGMHQLSGVVVTPLFRHLGMSSWHSFDGAIITLFKPGHALSIIPFGLVLRVAGIFVVVYTIVQIWRKRSRHDSYDELQEKLHTFKWETEISRRDALV